jgi:hypothetical protein
MTIGDWISETEGFEGSLLDPNWWEVRRARLGALWYWAHEPYWDQQAEIERRMRKAAPIAEGG